MLKQVIVVRTDLDISKGKLAAQVAHASVEAAFRSNPKIVNAWREEYSKKVVLKVATDREMVELQKKAAKAKLVAVLIKDAGFTELEPGTMTALGIGPETEAKIDKITGNLKLL
jgi:PTH2 family peptidyl-tRNA hydrolase